MKGTIFENRLPRGTKVKKVLDPSSRGFKLVTVNHCTYFCTTVSTVQSRNTTN